MAAPDFKSLAKQIATDVLSAMPFGTIMPIVMMIRHEPGSNVFCLVWEPGKIYAGMLGVSIFLILLIISRWQKWRDLRKD